MPSAFLSYASRVEKVMGLPMDRIRAAIQREVEATVPGFEIWFDQDDLPAGSDWAKALREGLYTSSALIPILTPQWFASPHCRAEFLQFQKHRDEKGLKRNIFPIALSEYSKFVLGADNPEIKQIYRAISQIQISDWSKHRHKLQSHASDENLVPEVIWAKIRKDLAPSLGLSILEDSSSTSMRLQTSAINPKDARRVCDAIVYNVPRKSPVSLDVLGGGNVVTNDRVSVLMQPRTRNISVRIEDFNIELELNQFEVRIESVGGPISDATDKPPANYIGSCRWEFLSKEVRGLSDFIKMCEISTVQPNTQTTIEVIVEPSFFSYARNHDLPINHDMSKLALLFLGRHSLESIDDDVPEDSAHKIAQVTLSTSMQEVGA